MQKGIEIVKPATQKNHFEDPKKGVDKCREIHLLLCLQDSLSSGLMAPLNPRNDAVEGINIHGVATWVSRNCATPASTKTRSINRGDSMLPVTLIKEYAAASFLLFPIGDLQ